jgi:DNA-binding response OmpR family regulator
MATKKIVIIEDEPDILDILSFNLKREGYDVYSSSDGIKGLALVNKVVPDLVLLDLMLPGLDGVEICSSIKNTHQTTDTLVVMVTAKGEESDIVLGLGVGADDYVTKPFSPKELVARVKAVLRRGRMPALQDKQATITLGDLTIDPVKHQVFFAGTPLRLTATEFRLLYCLSRNPGHVFTRDHLLANVMGDGTFIVDRNIDVHVRGIRKKMHVEPPLIETIRGVGYRLREP